MSASLREIVRRKAALLQGKARPGRVTQVVADGSGGLRKQFIDPEVFRRQQARRHQVDVAAVRARLGLSQREFSLLLGVSPRTFQNWEQGHRQPAGAARVLLIVAEKHPEVVLKAATG